jgi:hypothetical protein
MASIEIEDGTAVVIYDRRSGKVIHIHEEIVLEGGRKNSQAEVTEIALKLARTFAQKKVGEISSLVLQSKNIPGGSPLRMDLKKKSLIAITEKTRTARRISKKKIRRSK